MKRRVGTQKVRLARWLDQGRPITPLEAWPQLGIARLAARILELKQDGYNIGRELIAVKNQFGEKVEVAQYKLKKEMS